MSTASHWSAALRSIVLQPTDGIIGLVDGLLSLCRQHSLELDWQAGRCRARSAGGEWYDLDDVPLRKSVFRAVLARLAALCNERRPGSVSPYGGTGEIAVDGNPVTVFRVAFTNTPDQQRFELARDGTAGGLSHVYLDTSVLLSGLLAEVPRLRRDLPGWAAGRLVPALAAFHDDASDAEIASATSQLRKMLQARADIDSWLGDIATLGTQEYAGNRRSMTPAYQLPPHVELPPDRIRNRTIVEQARRLAGALTPAAVKTENGVSSPLPSRPDGKK